MNDNNYLSQVEKPGVGSFVAVALLIGAFGLAAIGNVRKVEKPDEARDRLVAAIKSNYKRSGLPEQCRHLADVTAPDDGED